MHIDVVCIKVGLQKKPSINSFYFSILNAYIQIIFYNVKEIGRKSTENQYRRYTFLVLKLSLIWSSTRLNHTQIDFQ